MSESIQSPIHLTQQRPGTACAVADDARRRWLLDAAELYGRPLAADLDELDDHLVDDRTAVLLAFPWLSDAELIEALWALGVATAAT
jgi:hypothetical protein